MEHVTHKTCLKVLCTALLAAATFIAVSISSIAQAKPVDMQITQEVSHEVACFVYARAMHVDEAAVKTHLSRVDKASGTAGAVYRLGYVEGLLDGLASSNAESLGGYGVARMHAAAYFYKLIGCTVNESI